MDKCSITLTPALDASQDATYALGDKNYDLPAFTTDYGCCNCFNALDGFFCKHQLLALRVRYLGRGEASLENSNKFHTVCVKYLGTTFTNKGGCTLDCIAPVITALSTAFPTCVAGACDPEPAAVCMLDTAAAREAVAQEVAVATPSAVPSPPRLAQAAPVVRHSPATKALRQGAQVGLDRFADVYGELLSDGVPHHVRQKWVPHIDSMMCQIRQAISAAPQAQPAAVVPQFQRHLGPLSEKRVKSAGETGHKRTRAQASSSVQLVPDFCKTALVEYNESRKLPQDLAGRIDRAAAAAEARLDPVEAAAAIPKSAVATGRRLVQQAEARAQLQAGIIEAADAQLQAGIPRCRTGQRKPRRRHLTGCVHGPWDDWGSGPGL
jgi:hypothetical protein